MRDAAYRASVALAREKGAFPLLRRREAARLRHGAAAARRHPRRDRARTACATATCCRSRPTGTISLAFADNASNGIEPAYSWTYTPQEARAGRLDARVPGRGPRLAALARARRRATALPPAFVNALRDPARDHMAMQAAIQPYVDAAISKTVNVPEDYPFEDFEDLYLEAWQAGLKGITTYRPNSVLGSVLSVDAHARPQDLDQSEPDRRIRISDAPQVALAALRWPHRPKLTAGSPSWTYMVEAPAATASRSSSAMSRTARRSRSRSG